MHGCLVPMIPRLTLGGPEGEPHRETATSALTGKATFSCILCFYKYFYKNTVSGVAIPYRYSGKSRTYKNFEKKTRPFRACSRLGGTTLRKIYGKKVPLPFYHRVFRSPIKFLPDVQGKKKHRY